MSFRREAEQGGPGTQEPGAALLFLIPYSDTTAFVWCPEAEGRGIVDLRVGEAGAAILERKKLVRPGRSLEVLFIACDGLRDGTRCDLHVASRAAEPDVLPVIAQLARWDDRDAPSVLKLIARRFSPGQGYPQVLARYLAYVSSWQVPSRVLAAFPEGRLVELEADAHDDEFNLYEVTPSGLRCETLRAHRRDGTLLAWLAAAHPRSCYLELSGALVRLSLEGTAPSSAAGAQSTCADTIDILHAAVDGPSREMAAWAADRCQSSARVAWRDTTVTLVRAVHLPSGTLALFLTAAGPVFDFGPFRLEAFGHAEPLTITVTARDGDDDGEGRQWIVTADARQSTADCYKLTWSLSGRSFAAWIATTEARDPRNADLVRDFAPLASLSERIFPAVLHPLATAAGMEQEPRRVRVESFGEGSRSDGADVFVFVGQDLEAAHRTVLAVSLTAREQVRCTQLCVFDRLAACDLAAAAASWSATYAVPLRIVQFGARTSEAEVVRHCFEGDVPRIFVRAGKVPLSKDWLEQVVTQLQAAPAGFLLGVSAAADLSSLGTNGAPLAPFLSANDHESVPDLITAAAVAPTTAPRSEVLPRLYSLEAFLLAQAILGSEGETILPLTPELSFVKGGTLDPRDAFVDRLDRHSLQSLVPSAATLRTPVYETGRRTAGARPPNPAVREDIP